MKRCVTQNRYMTMRYSTLSAVMTFAVLLLASACGSGTAVELGSESPVDSVAIATVLSSPTEGSEVSTATPLPPQPTQTTAATRQAPTAPPALTATVAAAGNADVLHVRAVQSAAGTWTFQVTVQHPDTGWEDYADGWDVVLPDGMVLKPDPGSPFTRLLLHPHTGEQSFTRSQSGITIPAGITAVRVRAHDIVDGFGGREVVVDLTVSSGDSFEVEPQP